MRECHRLASVEDRGEHGPLCVDSKKKRSLFLVD